MQIHFRHGFYLGLFLALLLGIFFWRLWRPERQVQLHTQHLLHAIEERDWDWLNREIDPAYADQWNADRDTLLSRLREALPFARHLQLQSDVPIVLIDGAQGVWKAKITLQADGNELADMMKQRVNSLDAPFVLEWRRASGKPWDWRLRHASNSALDLPNESL